MTLLKSLIVLMVLAPVGAYASDQYRKTVCNIRYNSSEILVADVKCEAWFGQSSLARVKFYYPTTKTWYDWSTSQPQVTKDTRWRECVRLTTKEGNQWQVCTVPSPEELGI